MIKSNIGNTVSILALCALAVSCSQNASNVERFEIAAEKAAPSSTQVVSEAVVPQEAVRADIASTPAEGGGGTTSPQNNTQVLSPSNYRPMLAYQYSVGFMLPQNKIENQLKAHQLACERAGMQKCQVISADVSNDDSYVSGNLNLRAEPQWLSSFRANLASDADKSGGRIISSNTSSEDLSRQITDTEARIRAQTAMAQRLERMIAERPGKLSDLLEAERELARVQGEIDSMQSNLLINKARVEMSNLSISYSSRPNAVNNSGLEPLRQAFLGFFGNVFSGFAIIIELISRLLPFALVIGLIAIFFKKFGFKSILKSKKPSKNSAEETN